MKPLKQMKQAGFTLIETMVVVFVIGVIMYLSAPALKGVTTGPTSKQIYDFASKAATNWRHLNTTCGTTTDIATSNVVATPSATNAMALIVSGTSSTYLNPTYSGCANESGIQLLHTKVSGSVGAYKIAGYPITWSGGGSLPIKFVVSGVPTEVALPLYKQYSSAANASIATTFPTGADNTDPIFQFTDVGSNGTADVTLVIN
ncbi:prepilin-type N-terminal cleavage/methylation domain-containing protein [Janthinobacterium sp. CAN_S7]|uniref:type II secretion system protein n=1 Tax=Janthinobacterium sp. CAN_S7 TaxID=3071704 RepID=UPI00319DEE78